jgi:SAM-dependent methyltransferase
VKPTVVPNSSDVYYNGKYWNDFSEVRSQLNYRATGSRNLDWIGYLLENYPAGEALILNCGNGWVERELVDRGFITKCLATDISQDLILEATNSAGARPIEYIVGDINTFEFEPNRFDYVINFAACHHIAFLERTLSGVNLSLKPDGRLITWDYVGPHRNQYPYEMWEAVNAVNNSLPEFVRKDLVYPHLPTMLISDPTEAVHSELFVEILNFYFTSDVLKPLGGAIAYELLTHNPNLDNLKEDEVSEVVLKIMELDNQLSAMSLEKSLFVFGISKPRSLSSEEQRISQNRLEFEVAREEAATETRTYYEISLLQSMTNLISDLKISCEHLTTHFNEIVHNTNLAKEKELTEYRNQVQALLNSKSWRATQSLRTLAKKIYK